MHDMLLNPVWQHLVDRPRSSHAALVAAQEASDVPVAHDLGFALTEARSWAECILRSTYAPHDSVLFIGFRQEESRFDVVRAIWSVNELTLEVAQTVHVVNIRVHMSRTASATRPILPEELAPRLLATRAPVAFGVAGQLAGFDVGIRHPAVSGPDDPRWPSWEHTLRCWSRGDELGFVALKAPGGPTRAVIRGDEQSNRVWR
jgi:hypothetical protein